jgi:hypothetical protein
MFYLLYLVEVMEIMESSQTSLKSVPCSLCKFIIQYLYTVVGDNRSAAAVEEALDKVCNILPATMRPDCTSFVTKYGPTIAILLAQNKTPEQICDFIKVCNNGTQDITRSKWNAALFFSFNERFLIYR